MDDTIEKLIEAWCKYLNHKHNLYVSPDDITDWDISTFYPTLTKEEIVEPLHTEEFWLTVHPRIDAMQYIQKLYDDGDDVYIVTASDYRAIKSKFDNILRRYFPCISWDHVIVAANKQMVAGDVLVDDGIHNLEGGGYKKILMTAPYNKGYNAEANGMVRVSSWEEVYDVIQDIKKKQEVQQ
jgi:5'(3')-deoxyribonucleotidase